MAVSLTADRTPVTPTRDDGERLDEERLRSHLEYLIERGVNGLGHDLVTCTYTGAVSGNAYTATGFFTP